MTQASDVDTRETTYRYYVYIEYTGDLSSMKGYKIACMA